MYDTLVCQLRTAEAHGKDVFLAGHSLGGSLITVFATALLERSVYVR